MSSTWQNLSRSPKSLLINWAKLVPFDRWYRQKYKIGFNSLEHRAVSPIDMYLEYCEDVYVFQEKEWTKIYESRREKADNGEWILIRDRLLKDEAAIFASLSLDKLTQALLPDGEIQSE